MLMVSSSEGMFDGVHSNTSNLRPAVTLNLVFVVGTSSLQERLVDTSTSSNNTNGGTASGVQNLRKSIIKNEIIKKILVKSTTLS